MIISRVASIYFYTRFRAMALILGRGGRVYKATTRDLLVFRGVFILRVSGIWVRGGVL